MIKSLRYPARYAAAVILSALCMMHLGACDESLPPRDDPQNFLTAALEAGYYYGRTDESIFLTLKVRNIYTETFSDTTAIFGFITIQWKDYPNFQKTFVLTAADLKKIYFVPQLGTSLMTKSEYDPGQKVLTIPENEITVLQCRWDLKSEAGEDLRSLVRYTPDVQNPGVSHTPALQFVITAGVHLYKDIPMLYPKPYLYTQRLAHPN